jgi:hypothetical protein
LHRAGDEELDEDDAHGEGVGLMHVCSVGSIVY